MGVLITAIIFSVLLILIDAVPLYKQKKWMEFCVYCGLLALFIVFAAVVAFNVKIHSPSKAIENIVTAIWGLQE